MARKKLLFKRLVVLALLTGLIGLASPVPAAAQPLQAGTTIKVTTFTDDNNVRNGNCTLREAIQAANVNRAVDRCPAGSATETDTIQLVAGTYVISVEGIREDANFKGDFDIGQSINILGAGMDKTFIDAKGVDRVFDNRSTSATLRIKDLTIQNGYTGRDNMFDHGGAIFNRGSLLVTRVRFLRNSVTSLTKEKGGAIYNEKAAHMELTDTLLVENHAEWEGGAISNRGTAKLWRVTFTDNYAASSPAIFTADAGSAMEIYDSTFTGGVCGTGGNSAVFQGAGASLLVERTVFDSNTSCEGEVLGNKGAMTVRYSTFSNNRSDMEAIILNLGGTLNLTHSRVFGNQAGYGDDPIVEVTDGKVVIDRVTINDNASTALLVRAGQVKVANSTFANPGEGIQGCPGGICVCGGEVSLESVTVANNRDGALAVNGGSVIVHNTILANSANAEGAPVADCRSAPGTLVSKGYNLVGRSDGCNWTPAAGDLLGTTAAPIDPLLDTLKENGGPTNTRALLPGSPAIDKADPANTLRTDQRIYIRPAGPRSDMGAFEANSKPAQ